MKKFIILFILLIVVLIIFSTYTVSYADELTLSGEGAVLIDMNTSQVLYEKNAYSQFFPASTTKIMTAILAIENGKMDDIVTIDQEVVDLTSGSHIALEPGEMLSLEQLVNALLIESANDAALAIGKHISGNLEDFYKLMNEKARSLGALNTNFENPNGLPNDNHLTTPYDLALIANYAMKNETFRSIVKNHTSIIPKTNKKSEQRYLNSSNRLLYSNAKIDVNGKLVPTKYDGVTGVKSGYTVAAQQCLVTSFEKGDHKLIAVVLKSNGKNIYSDTHKLLNYGINNFEKVKIGFANKFIDNFPIENGTIPLVSGVTRSDSYYIVHKDKKNKIKEEIILNPNLKAPIFKGDSIGKIEYYYDNDLVAQTDIISTMDIKEIERPNIISLIMDKWYILLLLLIIIDKLFKYVKRKQRIKRRKLYNNKAI